MRVSLNSSALTVLSFKINGIITQKAANSKTATILNKFLFLTVCFILYLPKFFCVLPFHLKCFGGTSRETGLSNEQCERFNKKDSPRKFLKKEKSQPRKGLAFDA